MTTTTHTTNTHPQYRPPAAFVAEVDQLVAQYLSENRGES